MIFLQYALPAAMALLLILFFSGLPNLKTCRLFPEDGTPEPLEENSRGCGASRAFGRRDLLVILPLTLLYAATAFFNLGDTEAPQSFAPMYGQSAVLELKADAPPARIMLYTGVGSGEYEIEYSADGAAYSTVLSFSQGHAEVLKWHSLSPETELVPRYVRISCTGSTAYLGEIVLQDGDGRPIPVDCTIPALCDEQELAPASQSFRNSTYFDEIYHARTAWEHLEGIWPYEITHPPLGKLILSIGISLFGMTPFGWRFMGTLFGVLMLPVMYLLLKRLFGGVAVPALGTVVFAADFMHYVQTRIATIDTYAVFFILLMYLCMYEFYSRGDRRCLALSGLFFGLGAASKWTCIYAGAGLGVLWAMYWIREYTAARRSSANTEPVFHAFLKNSLFCTVFFILIPCLIYYLSYLPYGKAEGVSLFSGEYLKIVLDNQAYMFSYHSGIVSEHPYSSRWYQWILDIRPILYYLEYFDDGGRSSICAFVSPVLCWGGLLSLFVLGYTALFRRDRTAAFILIGYLAQLVPWIFIRRLTFEYHYFPASVFLVLALGYVFRLFKLNRRDWACWTVSFAVVSVLLFLLFFQALNGLKVDNRLASALMGWFPTWPI